MFIRKVTTASGATAVQVAQRINGRDKVVKHIGSAHTPDQLALLVAKAREFINPGQQAFDLEALSGTSITGPVAQSHSARLLWQTLEQAWDTYGFAAVIKDEAFKQLVLARLIKPASKRATSDILTRLGLPSCTPRSYYRALQRASERDYRARIENACLAWASGRGDMSLLLYDVTTLYFETDDEDTDPTRAVQRRVGMSKERRIDPQIILGLLVDRAGNPLRVRAYSGNKAEKNTIIDLVAAFSAEHDLDSFIVVAHAGMLSRANMQALDEAGMKFIVGARQSRAPLDLEHHYHWYADAYRDGQIIATTTPKHASTQLKDLTKRHKPAWEESMTSAWKAIWHYSAARYARDMRALNAQRDKAIAIVEGDRPARTSRFVSAKAGGLSFNEATWQRAKRVAGLKGYVTNIPETVMSEEEIVASYHELWHVEQSFRMSKSDLKARPIYHHSEQAIEAHLTIVIAALAISRYLYATTGMTTPRIIAMLKPLRDTIILMPNGQRIPVPTAIPPQAQDLLNTLTQEELTH